MITKRVWVAVLILALAVGALPVWAQEGEDLTETFTFPDKSISFQHPAGWVCGEPDTTFPDSVTCMSSAEAYDAAMGGEAVPVPSGELLFSVMGPRSLAVFYTMVGAAPVTLADLLALFAVSSEDMQSTYGDAEEIEIAGNPALQSEFTDITGEGVMLAVDFDGAFMLVTMTAAAGEFARQEALIYAVLDTLALGAPEGILSFTSSDGVLSLEYGAGWFVMETAPGEVLIADNINTYRAVLSRQDLAPGSFMIHVFAPASDYFGNWVDADAVGAEAADQMLVLWLHNILSKEVMDPVEVTIGEYAGARIEYASEFHDGYALVYDQDGARIMVLVSVARGELPDHEAAFTALVESIRYTP